MPFLLQVRATSERRALLDQRLRTRGCSTGGALRDAHGRIHDYLRISLTEKCSFRCELLSKYSSRTTRLPGSGGFGRTSSRSFPWAALFLATALNCRHKAPLYETPARTHALFSLLASPRLCYGLTTNEGTNERLGKASLACGVATLLAQESVFWLSAELEIFSAE